MSLRFLLGMLAIIFYLLHWGLKVLVWASGLIDVEVNVWGWPIQTTPAIDKDFLQIAETLQYLAVVFFTMALFA